MFEDVLTKAYYGNSLGTYLLSFLLIIASLVAAKLAYWVIGHVVKRFTVKTKNKRVMQQMCGPQSLRN